MIEATVRVEEYPRVNDLAPWCLVRVPYPHRGMLKEMGAEWTPRERAWFIWAGQLPELRRRADEAGLPVVVSRGR